MRRRVRGRGRCVCHLLERRGQAATCQLPLVPMLHPTPKAEHLPFSIPVLLSAVPAFPALGGESPARPEGMRVRTPRGVPQIHLRSGWWGSALAPFRLLEVAPLVLLLKKSRNRVICVVPELE